MNRVAQSVQRAATLCGLLASLASGCGDTAADDGLKIKACFAADVPRRDAAVRVEAYLIDSCELLAPAERPSDPIGSTLSLKGGSEGPPIELPPPGQYALYAIAQDSDDVVVAAGCVLLTVGAQSPDTVSSVRMEALSSFRCSEDGPCLVDTGKCIDSNPGTGGSGGSGGSGGCVDMDGDGYCIDADCDDSVPSCSSDCQTNSDQDAQVDCFEEFCGSDPRDTTSVCLEVSTEAEFTSAIDAANAQAGHDYIVLDNFTMTSDAPSFDDDEGVSIRQLAGASLTVDSDSNRVVFELEGHNNMLHGIRVAGLSHAETIVSIKGDNNIVQNCEIEGFARRGIYVDGGDDAQILHNIITGGTKSPGKETGAIVLRDTARSIVVGNTVALNHMDGVQVRKATAPVIDHNSLADNDGSGLAFYEEASSEICLRNNNVTGNQLFGLSASEAITFDTSPSCTAPLTEGPAYGNNAFDNAAACGGDACDACGCLPAGPFWSYREDPGYRSVTVGDRAFYCLGGSSTLIDGGAPLAYDLNGTAAGDFSGTGPDIGSREDGPADCN